MSHTFKTQIATRRNVLKLGSASLAAFFLPACDDDETTTTGTMAGENAGMMAGEMAGENAGMMAGENAGMMAGEMAGEMAGTMAGENAGMMAGEMMDLTVEERIAQWEAEGILTPNMPGMWAEKIVGHYPIAMSEGNTVSVFVPHPMTEEHYISAIYLKDENGGLLGFKELMPTDEMAMATFEIADGSIEYQAYSVCNLHQVWVAPQVRSAARPGPWAEKIAGHTPLVMMNGNEVTVNVPHPMTEDHFIVGLYITDQDGKMIDKVQLTSTDEPSYTFTITDEVTEVTPWALCDDHDLWIGGSLSRETNDKINTWESTGVLTPNDPGMWADKIAGHYPIATIADGTVSVVVPHPMTTEHYIAGIYLKDAMGHIVGFKELTPTDEAKASFDVIDRGDEFTAYAFCNLHEVWSAPLVRSESRPGPWADKVQSHTPVATIEAGSVIVTTNHPMTEDHFIVALYITDQDGTMIDKVQLNPTDYSEATYTFMLPEGVTAVTPWSLCDDHDLWVGAEVAVG